jgi:hypothetical protein
MASLLFVFLLILIVSILNSIYFYLICQVLREVKTYTLW